MALVVHPLLKGTIFAWWTVAAMFYNCATYFSLFTSSSTISNIVFALVSIAFQALLVHKTLSSYQIFLSTTKRLDAFLEESRKGQLALLIVGTTYLLFEGTMQLLDSVFCGSFCMRLWRWGRASEAFAAMIPFLTFFCLIGQLTADVWLIYTLVKSLWRIAAPLTPPAYGTDDADLLLEETTNKDEWGE